MTDNDSKTRPMRTLTVKNFSVIKEAKLEFGKITVLIGPQASGKSLLCRLAFFFSQFLPEYANNVARHRPPFKDIDRAIQQRFVDWFPSISWSSAESQISFASDSYSFSIGIERLQKQPEIHYESNFIDDYERWKSSDQEQNEAARILSGLPSGPFAPSGDVYIPSGRNFFSTPNKGIVATSQKNLDWVTQRFSTEMDYDYRAMIAAASERVELLHEFGAQSDEMLGGRIVEIDGTPRFQLRENARILPFELLSSGTLELLPILNPISKLVSRSMLSGLHRNALEPRGVVFVEEPESGIFPQTQYQLVRMLVWLTNTKATNQPFTITTHSPYILSALNNLLEAFQVAAAKPENRDEVGKLIPERYWIKPGDLKAYSIHDGRLDSIMDPEAELISSNYLDSVSDTIGAEFDELLRLGYVES